MHGSHYPPPALRAIWAPLLENLAVGTLRTALSSHILARLLAERACPDEEEEDGERASYECCLAAWGAWLVDWRLGNETDADVSARREDVFFQLIHALCTSCPCPQRCDEEQIPLGCQPGCVFPTATRARFFFFNISPPPLLIRCCFFDSARALLAALCASDSRLAGISDTVLPRATAIASTGAAAQVVSHLILEGVCANRPFLKFYYCNRRMPLLCQL